MGKTRKVKRYDSLESAWWMTKPFTRTTDGFLQGRAIVTSVGVFTYLNADGSVTRELRLPEEVFATNSLDSMKLKPVTNDHPTEKVTPDNTQELAVGTLGSNPSSTTQEYDWSGRYTPKEKLTDGFHVSIDMTINRADAIDDVVNGKRSLSMGYECDLEKAEEGAVWCGMAYDGIQRNIRYNHCAIVDMARAGDAATIHLDGADAVQIYKSGESRKTNPEVGNMGMKKINLDGVEYEGEEKIIVSYHEQKNRADTAEKALREAKQDHARAVSALEGERDSYKDRADKAEKELKEARDAAADPKKIDEAVKAKLTLIDTAIRAGVEVKKAVITAVFPQAKLDGKDEVYIAARFDATMEDLDAKADGESRQVLGGGLPPAGRRDSTAAYQRMVEMMNARSRGNKKEGV
jgi:hypothetical protein